MLSRDPPTNPSRHLKKERSVLPLKWLLKEDQGRRPTAASAAAPPRAAVVPAAETAASPCLVRYSSTCSLPAAAAAAAVRSQHRHPLRSSPLHEPASTSNPSTDLHHIVTIFHSPCHPSLCRSPTPPRRSALFPSEPPPSHQQFSSSNLVSRSPATSPPLSGCVLDLLLNPTPPAYLNSAARFASPSINSRHRHPSKLAVLLPSSACSFPRIRAPLPFLPSPTNISLHHPRTCRVIIAATSDRIFGLNAPISTPFHPTTIQAPLSYRPERYHTTPSPSSRILPLVPSITLALPPHS